MNRSDRKSLQQLVALASLALLSLRGALTCCSGEYGLKARNNTAASSIAFHWASSAFTEGVLYMLW